MTLGGIAIAIGALVDDAVVDVENIFRRLRENRAAGNPRSVFDVVVAASQEVRSGILYASVIIVLVFVPLFALSGIEGRLFSAARAGLHHRHPGKPRRLDHADAGDGLLHAAGAEASRRARKPAGARAQAALSRGARSRAEPRPRPSSPPTLIAVASGRGRRGAAAARVPAAVQRRHLHHQSRVQSRASRSRNPTASARSPSAWCSRCRRSSRSAGAPAAPSSTSMPRACIRPISKSISSRADGPRPKSSPTSARGWRCCRCRSTSASRSRTGSTTCCRGCAPTSRSRFSARTSTRCAAPPRSCGRGSRAFPALPTCRWKSRSAFRSSKSASITAARRSTACSPPPWSIS